MNYFSHFDAILTILQFYTHTLLPTILDALLQLKYLLYETITKWSPYMKENISFCPNFLLPRSLCLSTATMSSSTRSPRLSAAAVFSSTWNVICHGKEERHEFKGVIEPSRTQTLDVHLLIYLLKKLITYFFYSFVF